MIEQFEYLFVSLHNFDKKNRICYNRTLSPSNMYSGLIVEK